jgi:hypothetical protein
MSLIGSLLSILVVSHLFFFRLTCPITVLLSCVMSTYEVASLLR